MKKAFTLVELLIVIGIIAILSGVLLTSMSGGTESARNAQCLSNMKSLASACQTYGMANGHYPLAGSVERMEVRQKKRNSYEKVYDELSGWISWNSAGAYSGASKPTASAASANWYTSAYSQDDEAREYCITNGALYKYVSGNHNIYICPIHKHEAERNASKYGSKPPAWSYVMSSYFCWAGKDPKNKARDTSFGGVTYGSMKSADKRLLFAEIPFMGVESSPTISPSSGTSCDAILQYGDDEVIGFNHKSGKRNKFAHVVFADGHVDKLSWPKDGMDDSKVRELTKWLCEATDFNFNGKEYSDKFGAQ